MFSNKSIFRPSLVFLMMLTCLNGVYSQKAIPVADTSAVKAEQPILNALSAPVVFDGQNITCADLNASTDIRFTQIISDSELKLNFGDPNGTYPFTTGNGRVVVGPQDPTRSVTISSGSATVFSWSSQLPITAVNVKVGNTSYVYPYKPFKYSDTNLATGDNRGISHIVFCFGEPAGPTAADVSISGRVVDANGVGISKAQLVLINGTTGESKITMTNSFGYYSIPDVEVNELYVLNISHKRFNFEERQKTLTPTDSLTSVDFVAQP